MFKIQLIQNEAEQKAAFAIRHKVFVEEQQVSHEEEYDAYEDTSRHFLVFDEEKQEACGTARWRYTSNGVKLERFAILPNYRNQGLGSLLVQAVLEDVKNQSKTNPLIYLHAQVQAVNLYQRLGFVKEGDIFEEAGIQHYKMVKK